MRTPDHLLPKRFPSLPKKPVFSKVFCIQRPIPSFARRLPQLREIPSKSGSPLNESGSLLDLVSGSKLLPSQAAGMCRTPASGKPRPLPSRPLFASRPQAASATGSTIACGFGTYLLEMLVEGCHPAISDGSRSGQRPATCPPSPATSQTAHDDRRFHSSGSGFADRGSLAAVAVRPRSR